MEFNFTEIIGILGAIFVLVAFLANQTKKWSNEDFIYDFVNFLGSLFLVIYAILLKSIPFGILNFVWMSVSLRDLVIGKSTKK